ncbi:hypothetical protein ACA910_014715 [Epithemia clementina (nom. ined.)]
MAPRRNKNKQSNNEKEHIVAEGATPKTPPAVDHDAASCHDDGGPKTVSINKKKKAGRKNKLSSRSSSRLNATMSPSCQTRNERKARNVGIADSHVEKMRVAHLVKTYKDAEFKPCSVYGIDRREIYPGYFFCSNCDDADDWERAHGKYSRRGKSTYHASIASHTSLIYPTVRIDIRFLKRSVAWKAKARRSAQGKSRRTLQDRVTLDETTEALLPLVLKNTGASLLCQECSDASDNEEGKENSSVEEEEEDTIPNNTIAEKTIRQKRKMVHDTHLPIRCNKIHKTDYESNRNNKSRDTEYVSPENDSTGDSSSRDSAGATG